MNKQTLSEPFMIGRQQTFLASKNTFGLVSIGVI